MENSSVYHPPKQESKVNDHSGVLTNLSSIEKLAKVFKVNFQKQEYNQFLVLVKMKKELEEKEKAKQDKIKEDISLKTTKDEKGKTTIQQNNIPIQGEKKINVPSPVINTKKDLSPSNYLKSELKTNLSERTETTISKPKQDLLGHKRKSPSNVSPTVAVVERPEFGIVLKSYQEQMISLIKKY
ncbi:MAG: hypothetical protein MJ252_01770 [archaeon]|nr:hypothetical protein [archaeon]